MELGVEAYVSELICCCQPLRRYPLDERGRFCFWRSSDVLSATLGLLLLLSLPLRPLLTLAYCPPCRHATSRALAFVLRRGVGCG